MRRATGLSSHFSVQYNKAVSLMFKVLMIIYNNLVAEVDWKSILRL